MLKRTGEQSPFSLHTFRISATGTGPNADAVVHAINAAMRRPDHKATLEIRDHLGAVLDTIAIGFEISNRAAWRFLGSDGTVSGPGSHELARYADEGPPTAAARLMHHALTRAHQRRAPDMPVPWIFYVEPNDSPPQPPAPRVPYPGWQPGAADCEHTAIVNQHCTRCGARFPD